MLTIEFVLCCLLGSDGPSGQRAPTRKKAVSVANVARLIRCMDGSNKNNLVTITRTMLNVSISKEECTKLGTSFDFVNFLEYAVDVKECCLNLDKFFRAHEYMKALLPPVILQKITITCNECKKPHKRTDIFWENGEIPERFRENREMFEFVLKGRRIAEIERATEIALQYHVKGVREPISEQSVEDELRKVPCGECKACDDIAVLMRPMQRMPDWHLIQKSVDNHHRQVLLKTVRNHIQEYDTRNKRESCIAKCDIIVKEQIQQQLARRSAGQFTAEQKNQIHQELAGKFDECALQIELEVTEDYKEIVDMLLEQGFTETALVQLIAHIILKFTKQLATEAEISHRIRSILDLPWIASSEEIRLRYFKELALEVQRGDKKRAVRDFDDSKSGIESWYAKKIEERYNDASGDRIFSEEFEVGIGIYRRMISETKNVDEIVSIVSLTHTAGAGIVSDWPETQAFDLSEFDAFKNAILTRIDQKKKEYEVFESCYTPSKDRNVMSRLGCTEGCYCCGALCWGERGHDEHVDDTRIHHSSHQPIGLRGSHASESRHLRVRSCHMYKDDNLVNFRQFRKMP